MDEAAFWVGPPQDPDRYRLTHLLGAGGEGEVWRAVAASDSGEVAIKIDTVPDGVDDWEPRLAFLTSLRIKGLVRVEDAFIGPARHRTDDDYDRTPSYRYVVMEHVDGITLRSWLDENPEASAKERIRILRGVAATLSRLHAGAGRPEPITHGDVKPGNVIIGSDGNPVLVDLGLVRPSGSGPASGRTAAYSSPELRNPDSSPTPRTDTFSFAVTAMETLTGLTPPLAVDGSLDLEATRTRIGTTSALRTMPIIRRQLLRSLISEPERRPRTPVQVFAGRAVVVAVVLALLVVGGGSSAFALLATSGAPAPTAHPLAPTLTSPGSATPTYLVDPPRAPASHAPSPSATASATAPITLVDDGSILSGKLRGGSFYTIDDGCGPLPHVSNVLTDPLPDLGTWGGSTFGVTLSARENLEILTVEPTVVAAPRGPRQLMQTLRVSCPLPGPPPNVESPDQVRPHCPPPPPFRLDTRYVGNADTGDWHEAKGKHQDRSFGVSDTRCYRASFLAIDIGDCRTNADYRIVVTFRKLDDPTHLYTRTFPVIRMRARATHATFTTSLEGQVSDSVPFTGPACRRPGLFSTPYTSRKDEAYTLLIKAIHQAWLRNQSLTTAQAINKVIADLSGKYRQVLLPYDATTLSTVCADAARDPRRWRGTCGGAAAPQSTASPTPTSP